MSLKMLLNTSRDGFSRMTPALMPPPEPITPRPVEAPAIHPQAVGGIRPCMTTKSSWTDPVEQVVDVTANKQICVQQQDLVKVHERKSVHLRKRPGETIALAAVVEALALEVLT